MALQIRCPNGHVMQVADQRLGKELRCPRCHVLMLITAPPAPPTATVEDSPETFAIQEDIVPLDTAAEDDGQRQQTTAGMKKAQRIRLARLGLAFHYAALVCLLLAILCLIAGFLLARFVTDAEFADPVVLQVANGITLVFGGLRILFMGLVPLLSVVGSLLCLWLPPRTGAKWFMVASFALDCLGLLVLAVSLLLGGTAFVLAKPGAPASGRPIEGAVIGALAAIALLGAGVFEFGGWIMFMLALRALLSYFRDSYICGEALSLLVKGIALSICTPVYIIIAIVVGGYVGVKCDPIMGQILTGLMLIVAVLLWNLLLLKILAVIASARGHMEEWTWSAR